MRPELDRAHYCGSCGRLLTQDVCAHTGICIPCAQTASDFREARPHDVQMGLCEGCHRPVFEQDTFYALIGHITFGTTWLTEVFCSKECFDKVRMPV